VHKHGLMLEQQVFDFHCSLISNYWPSSSHRVLKVKPGISQHSKGNDTLHHEKNWKRY